MQVQRLRMNGKLFNDHFNGADHEFKLREDDDDVFASIPVSYSSTSSPLASPAGINHIEHRVSKMDTLAGVAIKYGVEVADLKRINGLVSDLQMFAYKTLQIPLPGRHPPSPHLSNGPEDDGREYTPIRRPSSDVMNLLETINSKNSQQKVSPGMNTVQGFYSLRTSKSGSFAEGSELTVYKTTKDYYLDDQQLRKGSPTSNSVPNRHRKSRSLANGFPVENVDAAEEKSTSEAMDNSDIERSMRRSKKADVKGTFHTPEMLLKDDTSNDFSNRIPKGLALRTKFTSRTEMEIPGSNAVSNGDSLVSNGQIMSVRKSISTPSFQDTEKNSSSRTASKWTLKPDVVARPIVDGLPKHINVRRIKTAMD